MNTPPSLSIIVPAHNEEAGLGRTLGRLLEGVAGGGAVEVVVVPNGCRDATAEVARTFEPRVRVIEREQPSKAAALDAGDRAASAFPRFYVDADVEVSGADLLAVAERMAQTGAATASVGLEMDLAGCSWPVRAYYAVWTSLPYVRQSTVGRGIYGLSREGRQRFDRFPDLIADDGFVRRLFSESETLIDWHFRSHVRAPKTLGDLLKIKTRSRLGEYELRAKGIASKQHASYGGAAGVILRHPRLWLAAPAYLYVNLVSRYRARKALADLGNYRWERDESSREAAPAPTTP